MTNNMKKLVIILILLSVIGCKKDTFGDSPTFQGSFLTGECLKSNLLSFSGMQKSGDNYLFSFSMDVASAVEYYNRVWLNYYSDYRIVPDDSVFEAFGVNRSLVKKEYDRLFESYIKTIPRNNDVMTVFYEGGLTLTANRSFAGINSGDNLEDLLIKSSSNRYLGMVEEDEQMVTLPLESGFKYDIVLPSSFSFYIPAKILGKQTHGTSFNLSIPVKSVQYLTWVFNKLDDGNAPMPCENIILTCTFCPFD